MLICPAFLKKKIAFFNLVHVVFIINGLEIVGEKTKQYKQTKSICVYTICISTVSYNMAVISLRG